MTKPNALARAKWKSSGLTDAHAKRLKLEALRPKDTLHLVGKEASALRINYFDERGRPTNFYRVRFLEPLPPSAGAVAALSAGKQQRYAQAAGSLNEIYLPPLTKKPWNDVLRDPGQGIVITEGELKAACACAHGFYAIGLGGVDLWRSKPREMSFLPQLEAIEWAKRPVTIVFDSDAAINPDVMRAQIRLAGELTRRGALPRVASLPSGPEKKKQGLDDFLIAKGRSGLEKVLNESHALEGAIALWKMNDDFVYVNSPGFVVSRESGFKMKPYNFIQHHAANLWHTEFTTSAEGTKTKEVQTAKVWLEWPHRFQVDQLTYAPAQNEIVDGCLNTWRGLGVTPKPGSVEPWTKLLDYLFKDATGKPMTEERTNFERWCAYPLQHPGAKLYTCYVLWGRAQGTGKTFVGYLLKDIYGENGIEIKDNHLRGGFNTWAEGKQFVLGDEVTGDGGQRTRADRLKGFITQQEMIINTKHLPEYRVTDCINYLFTSNHGDAFFLEDSDRRFRVHEVCAGPETTEFYARIDKWRKAGGAAALLHHLLRLDLGDFNPRAHAPMTDAKREMIDDGKSDVARWAKEFKENPAQTLLENLGGLTEEHAKSCELFTARELLRSYDQDGRGRVTETGLGKELKNVGITRVHGGKPVNTLHGTKRLYAVKNVERWTKASPKECAAHRDRFFGAGMREEKY